MERISSSQTTVRRVWPGAEQALALELYALAINPHVLALGFAKIETLL